MGIGHHVRLSDKELNWLIRIHKEFRNQFIHFSPTGWVFDVSGMQELARLIARIIQDILDCGWAFKHLGKERRELLKEDLSALAALEMPLVSQR